MEVFYNELSSQPLAISDEDARERIISLLRTMQELRNYDINIMRTHVGFYVEELASGYTFSSFFGDPTVSQTLKVLLQTIVASPFIEDVDSNEASSYISNTFNTRNHLNEIVSPEGMASSYLFGSPAVSIGSHEFWRSNLLSLTITPNGVPQEIKQENVLNLFSANCVSSEAFKDWLAYLNPPILLNSEENIYKEFPNSLFRFDRQAINDIVSWFYDDKRYLARVKELLNDIPNNPFLGGKGDTETLRGTHGKASKRIVGRDRIVYTYTKDLITVHQCRRHYGDT